jgi:hypothetical protein
MHVAAAAAAAASRSSSSRTTGVAIADNFERTSRGSCNETPGGLDTLALLLLLALCCIPSRWAVTLLLLLQVQACKVAAAVAA